MKNARFVASDVRVGALGVLQADRAASSGAVRLGTYELRPDPGERATMVVVTESEVVLLGSPSPEHDCDRAGCGLEHVLARGPRMAIVMSSDGDTETKQIARALFGDCWLTEQMRSPEDLVGFLREQFQKATEVTP